MRQPRLEAQAATALRASAFWDVPLIHMEKEKTVMKFKRQFRFGALAVLLAGVLLLSGCVTIKSEMVINPDLSGSRSVIMALDKTMMESMSQMGGTAEPGGTAVEQDPFADVKTQFSSVPGAVVEPYRDETGTKEGVKITIPFKDLNELATQKFSSDPSDSLDTITWSQEGNVYTLNFAVNTGNVAASAQGEDASAMSEQDKAMASQMMANMGFEMSYSIALPGKILDYSPKEGATYDSARNAVVWKLDLASGTSPNIMVKWDNGQAAAPIAAPTAQQLVTGGLAAPKTMAAEVQAYADAITRQDRNAYVALMAGGQMIPHPLMSDSPELFQQTSYKVTYNTVFADDKMGAAKWTGTWTIDGNTYTMNGIDVLTFDANGKVTAIESFVVPSQFMALKALVK
jgi:ketosteroid isomerase-like protein